MTTEFSYPALRCIIEYLEANKRIHITSRSKALQNFDKKIPLHINKLAFEWNFIKINHISYHFDHHHSDKVLANGRFRYWYEVLMPGDVSLESGFPNHDDFAYVNLDKDYNLRIRRQNQIPMIGFSRNSQNIVEKRIELAVPHDSYLPYKFSSKVLLGQRTTIQVSKLSVFTNVIRLPLSTKFRISALDTHSFDFRDLLPIIDPQSFPLKHLTAFPTTSEMCYHPIFQTAETFRYNSSGELNFLEPWHQRVLTLPHNHISLPRVNFDAEQMNHVIRGWLDNPREIGKTLVIRVIQQNYLKNLMAIKNEFGGKVVMGPRDEWVCSKAILIPVNSNSELLVVRTIEGIKLEAVPAGSTVTEDGLALNKWDASFSFWLYLFFLWLAFVMVSLPYVLFF